MKFANIKKNVVPTLLIVIIFLIITILFSNVGDPTYKNITNDSNFKIDSSYLTAPTNKPFETILSADHQFIPIMLKDIPWDFKQHAYWIKMIIQHEGKESLELVSHFDNAMLDELSIFQVNGTTEVVKKQQTGDHKNEVTFEQRTIPHFRFKIAPKDKTTLYIRIATTGIATTPIHIYHRNDFTLLVQKIYLLWGIFIGATVIIALYNLVLYFAARDFVYLIYNAYILSCVCLMGVVFGYGFYLFPEPVQLFFNLQVMALNCAVAIFTLLFLLCFLNFQSNKQWQYKLAIITIYSLLLVLISSLWISEYIIAPLFFIMMPPLYIVCFILMFTKIRAGLQWGKLYIYSWIPLLIGAAVQPLVLTGHIEYSFLSHHAFMIAILIEIVMMAMALADRMRYQKEKAIYRATHDLSSGLPNKKLLENHISFLINNQRAFSSCLIEIENYSRLLPYITSKALQKLEFQIIKDISPLLEGEFTVNIISDKQKLKLAKVYDGQLMFILEVTKKEQLTIFFDKLQQKVTTELQLNGLLVELKINIGICVSTESGLNMTANEFIQHARLAIEQNRESEGHLHYYHNLEVLNIKDHLELACDLQTAIRENKIDLYHQPQIDLKTGKVFGSEVLLRWQHPKHGFISPEIFVRIAEDTGLINELTRWVINCAFKQLDSLHAHQHLSHKVSINISGKDIGLPNFISYVKEKTMEFAVPRDVIIFELTESVMVTDFNVLDNLMVSLSELGIHVSIDDYGTGYSSLNYISQLKFDELKIDKAFILNLDKSTRNLAIVRTTIEMARNLRLKVVAEGVESKEIEQKLIESGCDIGQGYYYTQPLSFDRYLLWLDKYNNPGVEA